MVPVKKTIPIVGERAHAILSASGSYVWLNCHPGARLQEQFEDKDSEYSAEGTWMHHTSAYLLREYLGLPQEYPKLRDIPGFAKYSNAETSEAIAAYVRRGIAAIEEARKEDPNALVLVEERGDFSKWVPEGFGTADLVIVSNRRVRVRDLKGGKGKRISAEDNSQLKLYALMVVAALQGLFEFDEVVVEIDQPRLNEVAGGETMRVADLLSWAKDYVKPRAALAWEGKGEFNPGPWCVEGWCRARFSCKARAASMEDLVNRYFDADFEVEMDERGNDVQSLTVSDEQVAKWMPRLPALIKWAKDIQEYVEKSMLRDNKKWPGLKVVQGRSIRKITDPNGLAEALQMEGFNGALLYEMPTPPALLGIGALERVVGAKRFLELSKDYVTKPPGKPTVVPASDPRPEWIPNDADEDFDADDD